MFLDTARLGQMSPGAQQAQIDLARLAGREGASRRFERFLAAGFDEPGQVRQYPGLACWRGVSGLKSSLRVLAGSPPDLPVLVASRSAALMRFAARLLCRPCRNILTADVGWPGYHTILAAEAKRTNRRVTSVRLLEDVLSGVIDEDEVIDRVRTEYLARGCDGVFLPAVSSHGVRLPVGRIVRELESIREPRFVVIDGAQAYCHAPTELGTGYCDLYLAGCHKWLGGYHPLGLGFVGREQSTALVGTLLAQAIRSGTPDDPLLHLTTQLAAGETMATGETVNLTSLFTAHAAAEDALAGGRRIPESLGIRLANWASAAEVVAESGWRPVRTAASLRSGILVARPRSDQPRATGSEIRARFAIEGIVLTAYDDGAIRMSMPESPWTGDEVAYVARTFRRVAA